MFTDKNHFSLHIEKIKLEKNFPRYIDAICHFYDTETDQEMSEIIKLLNKKILDQIEYEAQEGKLLKHNEEVVRLL